MAARYAAGTEVPIDRSRTEIESTLRRYGATGYAYGWEGDPAVVGFVVRGWQVRFELPVPTPDEERFRLTPTGKKRTASAAKAEHETAVRQIWRVFAFMIKAMLEAVEAGLIDFEQQFLAHIVLPGGRTVGQEVGEKVAEACQTGQVPELLPTYQHAITVGRS